MNKQSMMEEVLNSESFNMHSKLLKDIFDKKTPVKFICLEYHRQGKTPIKDIQASLDLFEMNDYVAIAADINLLEFSFLRRDVYDKLNF